MPFVSDELMNEICSANDIIDYAATFMTLKRSGKSYMACCPFHNEKTPSFHIDRDKQLFHCFGCGASGNFVQLVMRLEGLDYRDALRQLADHAGITIPENGMRESNALTQKKEAILEMNKLAARFFYDSLMDKDVGKSARDYFVSRKLERKTIIRFGLGYSPEKSDALVSMLKEKGYSESQIEEAGLGVVRNGKMLDKFRGRVMYPIINARGKIIGFGGRILGNDKLPDGRRLAKYLNSPATPVFDKGSNLFALNLAKNSREKDIILCEGYMDVITVHQSGITNCVATLGTAITESQAKLMLRYGEEILICYDMDEAGTNAALKAIDIITAAGGKARVIRITGAKDPDEYISKYGVSGFKKAIEKAMPSTEFKLSLVKRKYDLTDTDGKIRFVDEAARVLASLTNPVEVEAYIKKTSSDTGISEQSIMGKYAEVKGKIRSYPPRTREEYKKREMNIINREKQPGEKVSAAVVAAEKRLLSIAASSRRLCIKAFDELPPELLSNAIYQTLAQRMYDCAKSGKPIEAAEILNEFSGDAQAENTAAAVFFNNEEYADDAATVYDLIYKIKLDKLKAKINNSTDPTEIKELINEQNELRKSHSQRMSNN